MVPPVPPTTEESDETNDHSPPQTGTEQPASNVPDAAAANVWDRAWGIEEIRKQAGNWSLAGDSGLLHYLQDFSQKMISRTHEMGREVDGLVHEAKLSGVRVHNVFNDFIMLANTQFVENRVYDEDVSQEAMTQDEKQHDQEKTREEKEADLIPRITSALKYGLDVIEDAFDLLDMTGVDDSDSEEDDTGVPYKADPIYDPKDPYIQRSLPYIIGTPQFLQEDNVGLVDVPSDISDDDESHGSLSVSEEEKDSDSDSSASGVDKKRRTVSVSSSSTGSSEEDEDSEGDLFGDGKSEEEEEDRALGSDKDSLSGDDEVSTGAKDFTSELTSKIGTAVPHVDSDSEREEEQNIERKVSSSKTKKSKKKKVPTATLR